MDEKVMLTWVDTILKPYVMTAPDGVVPIVFLDSYRCHMMSSVVEAVQDLGVEVEHIPGGCTGLCQPVDVGVNKPFKHRIRHQWERWMIAEGLVHGTTSPPSRLDICRWTLVAFQKLPEQMIRNAWRHGEYTWFPGSTREEYPQPTEGLLLAMSGKEIEEHKTTPQARDNCARTDLKDLPSLS